MSKYELTQLLMIIAIADTGISTTTGTPREHRKDNPARHTTHRTTTAQPASNRPIMSIASADINTLPVSSDLRQMLRNGK